ncbi:hypothetical protein BDR26DRAFT_861895 [Obelidium mucronatum]|nr:hypothetical protein BDR26DRAFT_861895 [Obelidium mucronatum]
MPSNTIPPTPIVPEGWVAVWSPESQRYFYANQNNNTMQWDPPLRGTAPPSHQPSAAPIVIVQPAPPSGSLSFGSVGQRIDNLVGQLAVHAKRAATKLPKVQVTVYKAETGPPPQVPPGWHANWSAKYNRWYFVNAVTGVSQWDLPMHPAARVHEESLPEYKPHA